MRVNTKYKNVLGIDISSTSVKVLELANAGQRCTVESYAAVPLPQGAVQERIIKEPAAVSETIANAIKLAKTRCKCAAVAIPDSAVITKVVQMDADLSDEDIESQLLFEAENYIPFPLSEVSMDFSVVGASKASSQMNDVLLVASRSDYVNTRVSCIEEAGIKVKIVDIESYAIERAIRNLVIAQLPEGGVGKTVAVVDMGAVATSLVVLHDLNTIFTRDELFGGQRLTEDIMRHYGLSFSEAGLAKKNRDLPDDYDVEVLNPFKEAVVVQIRRALQFFYSASQNSKIDQLLLAGGTVVLPGLAEMITDMIGIPTHVCEPFNNMITSSRVNTSNLMKDAPAMMICAGLAMRDPSGRRVTS